jgi:hypothetical protein
MDTNHSRDVIALATTRQRATGRRALIEHLRRQRENANLFLELAREAGIDTSDSANAPMIPCIVGNSIKVLRVWDALRRRGINAEPIFFPAVPEGQARLRFFVTSCHSEERIRLMVEALAEELELVNAGSRAPLGKRAADACGHKTFANIPQGACRMVISVSHDQKDD